MWTWNEEIYHEMLSPYKGGTVTAKVDLKMVFINYTYTVII